MNQNFSKEDFVNQNEIPMSLELLTNPKYKDLPPMAAILYGVLKYRIKLSARNRRAFEDENGLFIFFQREKIAELFNANLSTVNRWFKALADYDLIDTQKQGLGKPGKIYIRNLVPSESPISDTSESLIIDSSECLISDSFESGENESFKSLENETTEVAKMRCQMSQKRDTETLKNERSNVSKMRGPYREEKEVRMKNENEERESQERSVNFEPTLSEVQDFVSENGWSWDARSFYDYYSARGWRLNGTPIYNWQALCRVWNRREEERAIRNGKRTSGDTRSLDEKWGVVSYGSEEWERRYGKQKSADCSGNNGAVPDELPF